MFELINTVLLFVPIVASTVAAVYAYKAYELVKLEREIRIAREAVEEGKKQQ